MPFISSAILRTRSRICFRIATLSSSDNSAGDGAAAGNGGNRGALQMSMETSKETTLADTHQWKYIIISSACKRHSLAEGWITSTPEDEVSRDVTQPRVVVESH